jgi:hypothetical protein
MSKKRDVNHWRALENSGEYLGHWSILNLGVEEIEVTITDCYYEVVELLDMRTKRMKKERKGFLVFKEFEKHMMLNVVNPQQIAANTGTPKPADWIGETITIFATIAERNGKDCIRVKPQAPKPIDFDSVKAEFLKATTKKGLRKMLNDQPNRAKTKDLINYAKDLAKQLPED